MSLEETTTSPTSPSPPDGDVELIRLSPDGVLGHGDKTGDMHHFRTIEEAVAFAMERLTDEERKLAWIRAGDRSLSYQEIEQLYRQGGAPVEQHLTVERGA